jgi:hypothetical protein
MRHPCRQASEQGEVLRALGFPLRVRELLPTPIVLHEDADFRAEQLGHEGHGQIIHRAMVVPPQLVAMRQEDRRE